MSTCSYAALAAGLILLGADGRAEAPCQETVAFYVTVAQDVVDGYEVEHVAKVCTAHEHTLSGVEGYLTSCKIRIAA